MKVFKIRLVLVVAFLVMVVCLAPAVRLSVQSKSATLNPAQQLAHDILQQLIEINTTDSVGDCTAAANAMAGRLKAAGFPEEDLKVLGPHARKGNLVARLRGAGARKPILLLAHLDVVEAEREDWPVEPFQRSGERRVG